MDPAERNARGRKRQLLLGLLFGVAFGFLLQKGGVAKHHILVGVLLLQDFTVMKVMFSAIIVGMAGVMVLSHAGAVRLHVPPTRWAAATAGGLVFGAGFAVYGYCPGTGAAAVGQGNWDAAVGVLGMVAGSWAYAELSGALEGLRKRGDRGVLTLPRLFRVRRGAFIAVFLPILVAALVILEILTVR